MEAYIINSVACLAILFVFYKLLLEKENMHRFKRFYLLGAILASLIIPLITFTSYVEVPVLSKEQFLKGRFDPVEASSSLGSLDLKIMQYILYGFGAVFFGIKFCRNLQAILLKIKRNPQIHSGTTKNVLLKEEVIPHTFWNYIFLNQIKYERRQIPEEVIEHEQAHALQRHSADVLLLEILQVLFWFNPLIPFIKHSVKLNHEFLADRAVLQKGISTVTYQETLLIFSSGNLNSSLVNSINYSSLKKRFTVMKAQTSKKAIFTRILLVLPLLAVVVYSCSQKEEIENPGVEVLEVVETEQPSVPEIIEVVEHKIGEIATPGMIEEFNMRAKHYRSIGVTRDNVEDHEFKRLLFLYGKMTPEQRKAAEALPPPPPPMAASEKENILGPIVIEVREDSN